TPAPGDLSAYSAAAPGPAPCDTAGALWLSQDVTLSCPATGAQMTTATVAAKGLGILTFVPPSNAFAPNYRVSFHVDLSGMRTGCVFLAMRSSSAGSYEHAVCTINSYAILRSDAKTPLASGPLPGPLGTAFTVEATANGPTQSLAIDGQPVKSVTDGTYTTTTAFHLWLVNAATAPASAVLSAFHYTPLP
ncbi:MAG: hypothetical protein IVW57_16615, partial [Ktedonobacterales bacterium]|nr:hypothetical protein [Ktedonobacterales bacterium]